MTEKDVTGIKYTNQTLRLENGSTWEFTYSDGSDEDYSPLRLKITQANGGIEMDLDEVDWGVLTDLIAKVPRD